VFGVVQAKENSPVSDAPAKPVLAPQLLYVSEERIHLHAIEGCTDAGSVVRRRLLKRFSGGTGEDDAPFLLLGGVHQA
jgi:hypothetical protein